MARQRSTPFLIVLLIILFGLSGCATNGGASGSGGWVQVQRGDTLHRLSRRYGIPLLRLQRFNPGVDANDLKIGQRLMMPSRAERAPGSGPYRYQVRPGDTYGRIATHFRTSAQSIAGANPGVHPRSLSIGQTIKVPAGRSGSSASPVARTRPRVDTTSLPASARNWPWPLRQASVVRAFGTDAHGTLQPMMLRAGADHTARAVANGSVKFANSMRQLGNVVIVHHANNMQTIFAYCGQVHVREDQSVSPGTPICETARRGDIGHYNLLFDVRKAGQPVDPRRVLQ
ncbi:LysM peptidoglycan-binding domain-containing protein [Larsenimonas suaedae]|uniref:LysM peptidoglycan-binding domain-containing protein n=1 Tax=Larsenimonas suaedae TaxID=1851019 RepID=UPI00204249C6|nr:LysM peptidoglycan-binding domain-containing protein [Larsenimonas suaedae]MCM2971318.1 LysM peptidoglycan-binding domain-containing protein [Larsenimonas suaedae]